MASLRAGQSDLLREGGSCNILSFRGKLTRPTGPPNSSSQGRYRPRPPYRVECGYPRGDAYDRVMFRESKLRSPRRSNRSPRFPAQGITPLGRDFMDCEPVVRIVAHPEMSMPAEHLRHSFYTRVFIFHPTGVRVKSVLGCWTFSALFKASSGWPGIERLDGI